MQYAVSLGRALIGAEHATVVIDAESAQEAAQQALDGIRAADVDVSLYDRYDIHEHNVEPEGWEVYDVEPGRVTPPAAPVAPEET